MVWSTPMDDDPTDTFGTDVDLHLRHENASGQDPNNNGRLEPEEMRWASAAGKWDCYFSKQHPIGAIKPLDNRVSTSMTQMVPDQRILIWKTQRRASLTR